MRAAEQRFSIDPIARTRRQVERFHERFTDQPPGWNIDRDAAIGLLALFSRLELRAQCSLCTVAHNDGANGSGWTWALPSDSIVPPEGPAFDERSWRPVPPQGAHSHFMEAIDGDGSLRSYLQASIYAREVEELGARWHGVEWGTHSLVDEAAIELELDMWDWEAAPPAHWEPTARRDGDAVTVRFFTRSDLGQSRLIEHVDHYGANTLTPESERITMATGPGGFVF